MGKGGHGGGDTELLRDIFDLNPPADPLHRKANQRDGAYSILTGIAAYHCLDTGQPVRISDLLADAPIEAIPVDEMDLTVESEDLEIANATADIIDVLDAEVIGK